MTGLWFLFTLALPLFQYFTVIIQGQSMEGFISIDCGLPKEQSYKETGTGITYISDYEFIDTGVSGVVSDEFLYINDPTNSLRSFPNGTRNCYTIKSVIKGVKYLVRARFLYGNYDGKNKFPKFDLYLGINYWNTVSFFKSDYILFVEIVVVVVSNSVSICLVNTDNGIPFISAIDLRPIPYKLYLGANTSQSLVSTARQYFGGDEIIRYPNDTYDRSWYIDVQFTQWNKWNTSFSIVTSVYEEPSSVMQSLIFPKTGTSLSFTCSITSGGVCPSTHAYIILYFAELEKLMINESRILHVSVDDVIVSGEIQPEYLKTITFEKSITFSGNRFILSVENVSGSTKPPILNALEIYKIIDMTCQSETRTLDVEAMVDIKAFYKVKRNWNGDPCAPKDFMWEGLNCTFNGSNSPSITSLDLSSGDLSGGISASFANLTALHYLDLSNNTLSGQVPESLSSLSQLKFLSLANNNLTGSIPTSLLELSRNGNLNLSTEGNPFLCTNLDSCLNGTEKNRTVENPSSKKNGKLVVTVVVSCIVVVVLVVLTSIVFWRYRRRPRTVVSDVQSKDGLSPLQSDNTQFTYDELVRITNNFTRQIGRGGFGPVYHGTSNLGVQVAVKMLSHSSSQGLKEFQTEAKLLTRIHHKKLVALIGYCDDDTKALVYEYMEGGSLQDNLSGNRNRIPLSWRDRLRIACEAAQGIEYLHKGCRPSIVHRDVKTSNILLTKNLEARIADFGLSKLFEDDGTCNMSTKIVGTPGYVDPDYHINNQLSERSDVYSFGVVLMELITGLPAIIMKPEENIHIIQWVQQRLAGGDVSEIVDERIKEDYDVNSVWKLVEVAIACTELESVQRPDISEVVATLKDCLELSVAYDKDHTSGTVNRESGTSFSYEMSPQNQSSMVSPDPRDLSNNALTGSFSSLSQLKFLSLSNNNLTGSIPRSLLELSRNGYLNLSTEGNPFLCTNLDSCLNGTEKNRTVENPSSKKNGKLVVTVVVSCIVVVVLVVLTSIVFWRYRRRPRTVVSDVQSKDGLSPLQSDNTQFTYDELVRITNNFTRQIGRGGFGPVYHGTSNLGVQVAVKMLSHSSSQGLKEFQTEAKLLTRIHHRNLVPLIGYCNDDTDHLALVYEYMEGGSLQDNLLGKNNRIPLSWRERLRVAFEAAQGLEYLHKYCRPCIVHRDVKTSNILLTENLEARIADFGLSRLFEDDGISTVCTRVVGTRGYLDPDYHNNNRLRERSDVYSLGVVLMELITGLPAIIIKQEESIHIIQWVQEKLVGGDVSEIVDERIKENYDVNSVWKLVEVANACTNVQSVQRPDIAEVVAILKDCLEQSVAHDRGHRLRNANEHRGTSFSYQMTLDSQSSMVRPDPR